MLSSSSFCSNRNKRNERCLKASGLMQASLSFYDWNSHWISFCKLYAAMTRGLWCTLEVSCCDVGKNSKPMYIVNNNDEDSWKVAELNEQEIMRACQINAKRPNKQSKILNLNNTQPVWVNIDLHGKPMGSRFAIVIWHIECHYVCADRSTRFQNCWNSKSLNVSHSFWDFWNCIQIGCYISSERSCGRSRSQD